MGGDSRLNQIANPFIGGLNPVQSESALKHVDSRNYFNNAGIAGNQPINVQQNAYTGGQGGGSPKDEEDTFWYQSPGGN